MYILIVGLICASMENALVALMTGNADAMTGTAMTMLTAWMESALMQSAYTTATVRGVITASMENV